MQATEEPPFLAAGTEVSAKYRVAFCEAKVKKVVKTVKCKVSQPNSVVHRTMVCKVLTQLFNFLANRKVTVAQLHKTSHDFSEICIIIYRSTNEFSKLRNIDIIILYLLSVTRVAEL